MRCDYQRWRFPQNEHFKCAKNGFYKTLFPYSCFRKHLDKFCHSHIQLFTDTSQHWCHNSKNAKTQICSRPLHKTASHVHRICTHTTFSCIFLIVLRLLLTSSNKLINSIIYKIMVKNKSVYFGINHFFVIFSVSGHWISNTHPTDRNTEVYIINKILSSCAHSVLSSKLELWKQGINMLNHSQHYIHLWP